MDKYEIERLRSLPIESVAERLGLSVTRHKSLCPSHDDHHASLTYNCRRNTFRCFVCDAHGGTIDLVMNTLHKNFKEACRWLADGTNVILDIRRPSVSEEQVQAKPFDATRYLRHFEHPWLSDEARRFLFIERRLNERVVAWCRLTSWTDRQGTHWLQIPYYDTTGKLIGLQNRNLDYHKPKRINESNATIYSPLQRGGAGGGASSPRFRFPYGSCCSIYNLPVLAMLSPGEELYITEGASDCWAMLSSGRKAIAIPSATLLSEADKRQLAALAREKQTSFHMYPDRDAPGERLFLQLRDVLPDLQHHQLPPGCKDFAEYYLSTLPVAEVSGLRCTSTPTTNKQ